jgi:hypothetical protein
MCALRQITKALKVNQTLTVLDLAANNLGWNEKLGRGGEGRFDPVAVQEFACMLVMDNSTLTHVRLSSLTYLPIHQFTGQEPTLQLRFQNSKLSITDGVMIGTLMQNNSSAATLDISGHPTYPSTVYRI